MKPLEIIPPTHMSDSQLPLYMAYIHTVSILKLFINTTPFIIIGNQTDTYKDNIGLMIIIILSQTITSCATCIGQTIYEN